MVTANTIASRAQVLPTDHTLMAQVSEMHVPLGLAPRGAGDLWAIKPEVYSIVQWNERVAGTFSDHRVHLCAVVKNHSISPIEV